MTEGTYTKQGISKLLVLVLALVLVMGCVVGGTLAWLTAESGEVENTFTTSDISVTLDESANLDLQMVPGHTIEKDPKAAVTTGSEEAWLFVKIEESDNFDDYMTYEIADGWTRGDGEPDANGNTIPKGVIYRKVEIADIGTEYSVLNGDEVKVLGTVTKQMMAEAMANQPTLTFTAYASQLMKDNDTEFTAAEAWANVANPAGTTGN